MNTLMVDLSVKPSLLQVDLSHIMLGDQMPIMPAPCIEPQHYLPLHILSCSSVPVKQLSAPQYGNWASRALISGQCWTPPVQASKGHYPEETNISGTGCSNDPQSRGACQARESQFWLMPKLVGTPQQASLWAATARWYGPNQSFALSDPGSVGNSWGGQCPYCPMIQDSS